MARENWEKKAQVEGDGEEEVIQILEPIAQVEEMVPMGAPIMCESEEAGGPVETPLVSTVEKE